MTQQYKITGPAIYGGNTLSNPNLDGDVAETYGPFTEVL